MRKDRKEWRIVNITSGKPAKRHEACFVTCNGKGYLIGGRGKKPVDVYDPTEQIWTTKTGPGVELHHMQCVAVENNIWIVSSWTGGYPHEQNVDKIYVYDTVQDRWFTREGLPEGRRRGGGAAVHFNGEIYVSHGNRGGHGDHAKALGWLDKYNILEDRWIVNLTDAPNPRDHTGGVMIGDSMMFCVAGGRDSGVKEFFNEVILPTDCYDLSTNTWEVRAEIPQGRAGANYGRTCDGKLMIAGGEGFGEAFNNVDIFDGIGWEPFPSLVLGRHGSGLVFSCECDQVHVASGSIKQGAFETDTVESLFPGGRAVNCTRYSNVVSSSNVEGDARQLRVLVFLLPVACGIYLKSKKSLRKCCYRRKIGKS